MLTSNRLDVVVKWLEGAAVGGLFRVFIDANPVPASRPRVARNGGVFHTKNYAEYLNACQKGFSASRDVRTGGPGGPLLGPLAVAIDVRCARPRTSKLTAPRGDADNHVKGPLDGATKAGYWADDGQIEFLSVTKRWAEEGEAAGAQVWIARLA